MTARPDRLRDVVDAVIEALDEGLDGRALAARAMLSRFHFNRLVRAGIGEPPAAFRRRLLLERAAWRLGRGVSVTEAGLEAGYDALEAFSRAFARAHGVPPSRFADQPRDFRLAAPNGIHFHPPGGLLLPGQPRAMTMDLSERLIEHEHWHTARLLEQAAALSDDALDRHVRPGLTVHDFEGPEPDVRTMLERIVFTKEVWTAAIGGGDIPPRDQRSIPALQARLAVVQPQFGAGAADPRSQRVGRRLRRRALHTAGQLHLRQRDCPHPDGLGGSATNGDRRPARARRHGCRDSGSNRMGAHGRGARRGLSGIGIRD